VRRVLVGPTGNRGLCLLYHLRALEQMDVAEIVEKRPPPLCGLATLDFTCDYGRFSVLSRYALDAAPFVCYTVSVFGSSRCSVDGRITRMPGSVLMPARWSVQAQS
jgi:hypothetical protein